MPTKELNQSLPGVSGLTMPGSGVGSQIMQQNQPNQSSASPSDLQNQTDAGTSNIPTPASGVGIQIQKDQAKDVPLLGTKSAIDNVNDGKQYIDQTPPEQQAIAPAPLPPPPPEPEKKVDEPKATFVSEVGQKDELTQTQLDDPAIQEKLKDGGYVEQSSTGAIIREEDPEKLALEESARRSEEKVESLANEFLSYNVDQDPDFQAQSQQIKGQFDKLRDNMRKINESRQRAFTTRSFRTGTARFAGDIAAGILGEEISQGSQRIADITRQESAALSGARSAYKDSKWSEFSRKVDVLKDVREQKQDALNSYNDVLASVNERLDKKQEFDWKVLTWTQEQMFKVDSFDQEMEVKAKELGLDSEKFKLEGQKFAQSIKEFGFEHTIDLAKLDIQQADSTFDRQFKFQSLLSNLPEGQVVSIGGMVGQGRKALSDMSFSEKLELAKSGWTLAPNGEFIKEVDQASIDGAKLKIEDIKSLVDYDTQTGKIISSHPGFDEAVGPNPLARRIINPDEFLNSNRGNFVAGVEQMISTESLDALIASKAKGATFGALSDTEMAILQSSATKIAHWRKKGLFGLSDKVVGYGTTEKEFTKELNRFRTSAEKIIEYAEKERGQQQGDLLSPEDQVEKFYLENPDKRDYIDSLDTEKNPKTGEPFTSDEKMQLYEAMGIGFNHDPDTSVKGLTAITIGNQNLQVHGTVKSKLARADQLFFKATGKHIKVNEAYRSRERQGELYANYKSGKGGRAAPPGKSFHQTGKAVDVANWKEAEKYLRMAGFKNDLADDKNHFSIGEFA